MRYFQIYGRCRDGDRVPHVHGDVESPGPIWGRHLLWVVYWFRTGLLDQPQSAPDFKKYLMWLDLSQLQSKGNWCNVPIKLKVLAVKVSYNAEQLFWRYCKINSFMSPPNCAKLFPGSNVLYFQRNLFITFENILLTEPDMILLLTCRHNLTHIVISFKLKYILPGIPLVEIKHFTTTPLWLWISINHCFFSLLSWLKSWQMWNIFKLSVRSTSLQLQWLFLRSVTCSQRLETWAHLYSCTLVEVKQ